MDNSDGESTELGTIEEYLERRSWLANHATQFHCPDSCPRYGCKDPELHVPITLMDLVLQSLTLKARPSETYERFCKIGWSPENEVPWVGRVTMELKKPCGFLRGKWCEIYPARPIGCAHFPEAWFLWPCEDTHVIHIDRFRDYPCMKREPPISKERKKHLATLSEMAARERWLSDFYLFGFSPFYVDFRNLVEELVETAKLQGVAPDRIDPKVPLMIPYFLVEGLLQQKLKQAGIAREISKKVVDLDSPKKKGSLFELRTLTDEIRRSFGLNDVLIYHRFERDSLRSFHTMGKRALRPGRIRLGRQRKGDGCEGKEKRA